MRRWYSASRGTRNMLVPRVALHDSSTFVAVPLASISSCSCGMMARGPAGAACAAANRPTQDTASSSSAAHHHPSGRCPDSASVGVPPAARARAKGAHVLHLHGLGGPGRAARQQDGVGRRAQRRQRQRFRIGVGVGVRVRVRRRSVARGACTAARSAAALQHAEAHLAEEGLRALQPLHQLVQRSRLLCGAPRQPRRRHAVRSEALRRKPLRHLQRRVVVVRVIFVVVVVVVIGLVDGAVAIPMRRLRRQLILQRERCHPSARGRHFRILLLHLLLLLLFLLFRRRRRIRRRRLLPLWCLPRPWRRRRGHGGELPRELGVPGAHDSLVAVAHIRAGGGARDAHGGLAQVVEGVERAAVVGHVHWQAEALRGERLQQPHRGARARRGQHSRVQLRPQRRVLRAKRGRPQAQARNAARRGQLAGHDWRTYLADVAAGRGRAEGEERGRRQRHEARVRAQRGRTDAAPPH
eukprot:scaffold7618_cov269-Prasinococcus_capsulatus_cf.AAC.1